MKKSISLLLALLLACTLTGAWAEAALVGDEMAASPFNMPPLPGEVHTRWPLYLDGGDHLLDMTAVSDPASNCLIVTLNGLDAWGVAPVHMGCWIYDHTAGEWKAAESDIQPANGAVLMIDAEYYYMNGFPGWGFSGADSSFAYRLEDYSTDPNNPNYILQYVCQQGTIELAVTGGSYTLRSYGEDALTYSVYSNAGVLELGTHMLQTEDGTFASYAVTPDETEGGEGYKLYYIHVQAPDGGNWLWTDDHWEDVEGNEVAAPEGFSAEELPFVLIED